MAQIYSTNIIDFAVQHGFVVDLNDKKNDRNSVHVKNSDGLYLFRHGRGYKHFSTESKGNIVDFAKQFMGATDFKSAAELILGCRAVEPSEHFVQPVEKKARGDLVLPPKDSDFNRTIAYLVQTRGIDKEIVYAMINQNKVYQSRIEKNGSVFRNCAFVGYDGIDWREDHRIAEGCLSDKALYRYLERHPEITEIVFCYDNDMDGKLSDGTPHNHGQARAKLSAGIFADLGYTVFIQTPNQKTSTMI